MTFFTQQLFSEHKIFIFLWWSVDPWAVLCIANRWIRHTSTSIPRTCHEMDKKKDEKNKNLTINVWLFALMSLTRTRTWTLKLKLEELKKIAIRCSSIHIYETCGNLLHSSFFIITHVWHINIITFCTIERWNIMIIIQ